MFRDNQVKKLALERVLSYAGKLFPAEDQTHFTADNSSINIGPGGYSISINGNIDVNVSILRNDSLSEPLAANDFINYIKHNTVDTSTACEMLDCSRQNIAYLVKSGQLTPAAEGTKEKLYTRGSIEILRTE